MVEESPRPTVLVVDDDPSLRLLCRVNLELEGYRVLEANNLAQARSALTEGAVSLVLLDVHVGREDGRDLLEPIRALEPQPAVALFTGSFEPASELAGLADGVLPKPFSLEQLTALASRLTGGTLAA